MNEFVRKLENPDFEIPSYLKRRSNLNEKFEKSTGEVLNSRNHTKKIKFLSDFIQKMDIRKNQLNNIKKSSIKLNWVFGIRCDDLLNSFKFHQNKNNPNDCKLIYFVANLVIVYYYKQNKQRHYKEHKNQVCSISLAKNSNLIATGDCGKTPMI